MVGLWAQLDSKNWVGIDDVSPPALYILYYEKVQFGWAYGHPKHPKCEYGMAIEGRFVGGPLGTPPHGDSHRIPMGTRNGFL